MLPFILPLLETQLILIFGAPAVAPHFPPAPGRWCIVPALDRVPSSLRYHLPPAPVPVAMYTCLMACPACDLLDVGAGMGYKWIARVVEQWGHLLPEGLFPADAVSWPITCFRIGTLSPPEPAARERKEKKAGKCFWTYAFGPVPFFVFQHG